MPEPLQVMGDETFLSLKHPLQTRRFALALFFALILFPLIAAGLIAGTVVLLVPLFGFLLWLSGRVLFAYYLGNSILVSELNYPRIYGIGEELKTSIGYKKKVNIFVYEQGNFNAYLMKFLFYRRAVFLNSELLETGVSDDELRWLVGRFIGYLRARRQAGFWGWTIRAAQHLLIFNLFLLPYERALVYTGDRIAMAVISGDISCAIAAMQKLFVGRQLGYSVNPNGMVEQHRQVKGSFFAFLARLSMGFPHLTARYVDLIGFARERYPVQYERFEAENPGLPVDLPLLGALPQLNGKVHSGKDPIWAPLAGAVALLALLSFATYKLIVPRVWPSAASTTGSLAPVYTPTVAPVPPPPVETSSNAPPAVIEPAAEPSATVPTPSDTEAAATQPYVSVAGRFSVAFPGSPAHSTQPVPLAGTDTTTLHQFAVEDGGSKYLVLYNDYPAQYVPEDAQALLEKIRDGIAGKASLASDRVVEVDGAPGRLFTFTDDSGATVTVLDLLNGQRLYQVMVAPGAGSSATQAAEFLASFHIR